MEAGSYSNLPGACQSKPNKGWSYMSISVPQLLHDAM